MKIDACKLAFSLDKFIIFHQAAIIRSQKDTAHTKAERNILEAVKVRK